MPTDTAAAGAPQLTDQPSAVELRGVGKSFGGTPALRGIDLSIRPGEVHGLVGENGAGKSTLAKIIAGLYTADAGTLLVDDQGVSFGSPREALDRGIAAIAQELALVPALTVAENAFLGREPRTFGVIDRRRLRKQFVALADRAGFELDPDRVVGSLRLADQQKVEILRALARGASVIVMDEPTAALSATDTALLHGIVRQLAASGHTVVLVSHYLAEVLELCDTVTILRDGRLIRTAPAAAETEATLIEGMLGRTLGSVFPDKTPPPADADEVLVVRDLHAAGVNGVSLSVRAGEILGVAGLVGAGRSEIVHAVFGAVRRQGGTVVVAGREVPRPTIGSALKGGVFLIPESRKEQGLVMQRAVRENVTLSNLAKLAPGGWIRTSAERRQARAALDEVRVQGDEGRSVASLSGGNQQKVLFARALQRPRRVLIADEPTRGVDVGSRRSIYDLIVAQAQQGVGVVVVSSEVEEVLGLAHRIIVIRGGRIVAEFSGEGITEENILTAAFADPITSEDQ